MPGPKPGALPLGDTPTKKYKTTNIKLKKALYKSFLKKSS
ncbi:uncharacterized protein HPF13_0918 [Helicobacter pylori]|nr:uncharacterized protein HPF13_0918 [Helicobacter pylori]